MTFEKNNTFCGLGVWVSTGPNSMDPAHLYRAVIYISVYRWLWAFYIRHRP